MPATTSPPQENTHHSVEVVGHPPLLTRTTKCLADDMSNDRLRCAQRINLIHKLLTSVEAFCESAADDELDFICDVLAQWQKLRTGRVNATAPLLAACLGALDSLTCRVRVPEDQVELVKKYMAWAERNQVFAN
jgi:phosphohistidine phosphatase SixA